MSSLTNAVNQILSLLTIGSQIAIIGLIIVFALNKRNHRVFKFISEKAILFSFVIALVATLGSLFYSEIAGFEPCKLCWYQRILMYPQVVLLGLALVKRDSQVRDYALGLSLIGGLISGYHYLLQRGIAPALPCPAQGYSVNCSQVFVMNYGYITIPLMAFSAFVLIILLQLSLRKK